MIFILCLYGIKTSIANPPIRNKALRKECRQFCDRLKKEGWDVWKQSQQLSIAVTNYYEILESADDEKLSLVGYGVDKLPSKAMRKAEIHARVQYASAKGSHVNSYFSVKEKSDVNKSDSTTIILANQTSVSRNVVLPGPTLSICRVRHDGMTEVQLYYLVTPLK